MLSTNISRQTIVSQGKRFTLSLAQSAAEVEEIQRLRFKVFAEEMGATLPDNGGLDIDRYDAACRHLLVRDEDGGKVVGTYRLMTAEGAYDLGGWYAQSEFDVTRLQHILPQAVELGRACVHRDYRAGGVIALLWAGLAQFMQAQRLEYMIGCASVSMVDGGHAAADLFTQLQQTHYAPPEYRVFPLNPLPVEALRRGNAAEAPALLKGYLRAGAYVCGEPAWDADFNTADMLVMLPLSRLNPRYARHFLQAA
ncbi:MAG: GNAT family N-acyltransferase [Neisseria sp.]|nr:GNAT family N-acyltransferase [Neisseria sp.]